MKRLLSFLASFLRPSIEDSHEHVNALDLAPSKPDWLDRIRRAGW